MQTIKSKFDRPRRKMKKKYFVNLEFRNYICKHILLIKNKNISIIRIEQDILSEADICLREPLRKRGYYRNKNKHEKIKIQYA